ncbi:MAG: hypothetical protein ACMUHM_01485 [Thermoplasmatota archaeon]
MSDRSIKITPRYYLKLLLIALLAVLIGILIFYLLGNAGVILRDLRFVLLIVIVGMLFLAIVTTLITERNKVLLMVSKDMNEVVDTIHDVLARNDLEFKTEKKKVIIMGRVVKVELTRQKYTVKITENILHDLYIYFKPVKTLKVGGRFIEEILMERIKALEDIK